MSLRFAAVGVLALASVAQATVLYDGSLGTSIEAQGMTYGSFPFATFYTTNATSTRLVTSSSNGIYAGFGSASTPILNGFTSIDFKIQVQSYTSTSNDRAGFHVIALDSTRHGVELAFRPAEIFALGLPDAFSRAEAVSFAVGSAVTDYRLSFSGATYTLKAQGTTVLTGPMRDYSGANIPLGLPNPYILPNALFFGDDTTSAGGVTDISYIAVVPEPTTLAAIGLAAMVLRRRK